MVVQPPKAKVPAAAPKVKTAAAKPLAAKPVEEQSSSEYTYPEAAKIVNLHFPLIYIFARIYIPNLRKLKGKCKFYIFSKKCIF